MEKKLVFFVVCLNVITKAVTARDCSRMQGVDNCDDCFRCGGKWCKNATERDRCKIGGIPDDWCPNQVEQPKFKSDTTHGKRMPAHIEQTAKIGESTLTTINFKGQTSKNPSWSHSIINSTQDAKSFYIHKFEDCNKDECTMNLEVVADKNFCSANSDIYEHTNVRLRVEGLEDYTDIKYYVPCACECSKHPEINSDACSNHGDLVCGKCVCNDGWTKDRCQEEILYQQRGSRQRGDIPCSSYWNGKECYGNGKCNDGFCSCRNDTRGHQYLSSENDCIDMCAVTESQYDSCVEFEKCPDKNMVNIVPKDGTLLEERDIEDNNNFVWVKCVMNISGCQKEYAVKKDNGNNWSFYTFYIMPLTSCDPVSVPQSGNTNVYVSAILGALVVAAAATAVVGYVVWKNRSPPAPLTDPQYQNIDAEDCVGENPLYKPPTSSFKNPTYGKW